MQYPHLLVVLLWQLEVNLQYISQTYIQKRIIMYVYISLGYGNVYISLKWNLVRFAFASLCVAPTTVAVLHIKLTFNPQNKSKCNDVAELENML